jgi:hypothetical protein
VVGGIGVPRMVTVPLASGLPLLSWTVPLSEPDGEAVSAKFTVVVPPSVTAAGCDAGLYPKALAVTVYESTGSVSE